jgi:hypothetical protein
MSDAEITEPRKKPGYNLKGRPKGVRNKVTREVRAIAGGFGPAAVRRLAVLGGLIPKSQLKPGEQPASSEATQVVACSHLLNRAYGFPSQPLSHSADESFEALLDRLERRRLDEADPSPNLIELEVNPDGSFQAFSEPKEPADAAPQR